MQYLKSKQTEHLTKKLLNGYLNILTLFGFHMMEQRRQMTFIGLIEIMMVLANSREQYKILNGKVKELGVRATVGNKNLYKQMNIVDKMEELGVKYLYSDLMFANVENKLYYEDEINPLEYAKEFLKARKYAKEKGIYYGSFSQLILMKKQIFLVGHVFQCHI